MSQIKAVISDYYSELQKSFKTKKIDFKKLHLDEHIRIIAPNESFDGKESVEEMFHAFVSIVDRFDIKRQYFDDNSASTILDCVTSTAAGSVLTSEWILVNEGRITEIHTIFDTAAWAKTAKKTEMKQIEVKQNLDWFENVEFRAHPWPGLMWITASIQVPDVKAARDLYTTAFGFVSIFDLPDFSDSSNLMFSRLRYRGTNFVLVKEGFDDEGLSPVKHQPPPFLFYVYVDDVDKVYKNALALGMKSILQPQETFWDDYRARLICPFGYVWDIAKRIK